MLCAVEIDNLSKSFKNGVVAVSGLDLALPQGTICGLVGRNGAGKTTTLRLAMGLLRPDTGEARVLGRNLWDAPRSLREQVGYVSQNEQLPRWMSFTELQRYVSYFYSNWDASFARKLAREWGLPERRPVGELSSGEQRLAALILALAARPRVLMLDEPAAGLDPIARRGLLGCLVEAASSGEGCTILFSSHFVSDLERIVDSVVVMNRGRAVLTSRLDDLLQSTRRVQVIFEGAAPEGFSVSGAVRAETVGPVVTALVRLACESQLDALHEIPGARVNVFPMGLEEIFVELFGEEPKADLAPPETNLLLNPI